MGLGSSCAARCQLLASGGGQWGQQGGDAAGEVADQAAVVVLVFAAAAVRADAGQGQGHGQQAGGCGPGPGGKVLALAIKKHAVDAHDAGGRGPAQDKTVVARLGRAGVIAGLEIGVGQGAETEAGEDGRPEGAVVRRGCCCGRGQEADDR